MSDFWLSKRSLSHLSGGHPDLIRLVSLAISKTTIDFGVYEGERTDEEQEEMMRKGASRTLDSRHIASRDGIKMSVEDGGEFFAVDVLAFLGGKGRWEFKLYYEVARAFRDAGRELNIPVVWGGCWRVLNEIDDLEAAVSKYVLRKKKKGEVPLLDGPHFHLCRKVYPA